MNDYRIIVTASRDWPDSDAIRNQLYRAVSRMPSGYDRVVIIHGASGKGDRAAVEWVIEVRRNRNYGVEVIEEPHEALWAVPPRKGDPAGPRRNDEMAESGAHEALAFPWGDRRKSPGTWHCIEACATRGIPVSVFGRTRP